jgi:hypothetical protein
MAATSKPAPADPKAIAREISTENTAESPVVQSLRRQVANAVVLYLNYKHYHWQTYGRCSAICTSSSTASPKTCSKRSIRLPSACA